MPPSARTPWRVGKLEVDELIRHAPSRLRPPPGDLSSGDESSEDEEGERIKVRLGVGDGWALKGVSAACITNDWSKESDVISWPVVQHDGGGALATRSLAGAVQARGEEKKEGKEEEKEGEEEKTEQVTRLCKPRPSASWASWLLSFLLNHPPLRRLAMRASLFRALVAYVRSPWAPHRLRTVPLLTLLVRSHAEFEDGPPPLEELDGLVKAVLRECDRVTYGRGPGTAAWRQSDCAGSSQLEAKWASDGLLLLTDLVTATRRAQDTIRQSRRSSLGPSGMESKSPRTVGGLPGAGVSSDGDGAVEGVEAAGEAAVRVTLPAFGTRLGEAPLEEEEEEADEAERHLADRILMDEKPLGTEDRALLEVDLRNAVLPDDGHLSREGGLDTDMDKGSVDDGLVSGGPASPSRCLHHLLEISDTLRALREGWPGPARVGSRAQATTPPYLDGILCEAWMDAVGPAAVIESQHPFTKGVMEDTLCFPGAEELVVFLDPRSSMATVSGRGFGMGGFLDAEETRGHRAAERNERNELD